MSSKQLFFSRICGPAAHDRVGDREITRKIKELHAHVFTLSIFFPLFPEYLPIHSGGGKDVVCMGIESINLVCRVNNFVVTSQSILCVSAPKFGGEGTVR